MPKTASAWRLGLAFHLAFWLAAVALDFPRTYWDDSVIIGPAVSIAETGQLLNPYLTPRFYPGGTYLFYPPGFFWVLGGWIGLFGKTVTSLALFWAICALIASSSLALLLRRLSNSDVAWAVAPVLLFGCIAYTGHRYEILAFATYFAGLALATKGRRRRGYLLLMLTPTFAPTFLALCTVTVVAVFAHHWRGRFRAETSAVLVGFLIACATIVAGVAGDVVALFETMYGFRSVRIGFGGRDLVSYRLVAVIIGMNLTAAGIWLALARERWRSIRFQLPLLLTTAMLLTLLSHARPALIVAMNIATITLTALAIGEALAAVRWPKNRMQAAARMMPAAGLASVGAILLALNIRYMATIALPAFDPAMARTAQAAVAEIPAGQLIVADARVIKDGLEFSGGRRIEDSLIRDAWPGYQADFTALPATETWVTSRAALAATVQPDTVPVGADSFDTLFIATGMGRVTHDGICLIDPAKARSIARLPASAMTDAACGLPQTP